MKRILTVAKTEILEQRRQPWMLFILTANYLLWGSVFFFVVFLLDFASETPEMMAALRQQAPQLSIGGDADPFQNILKLSTSSFGALLFTNLPLYVAIMSGYSVLHDREVGALPFLMLAPLTRYQLLFGKLLGAMTIPYIMHVILVGPVLLVSGRFSIMIQFRDQLGYSPAFWVAYLIGAPASGLMVGALGTVISGLSKDVRTSMQYTSFFIGILSLVFGFSLFDGIPSGIVFQLVFAAGTILVGLGVLFLGSRIVSRDIS